ncbi:Hypothetical protein RY67_1263 [Bifidobacterium longum subsp. infantis]|uniref:Uncharacterized protein n=1 Tax=Bifidobacterium longum subsp. infantis TaxID=1682 RepID=A0A0M5KWA3_BIFLI|nr:Hypothetical protein RY67_1263 [Bifidobacterium longum subsp. infantis]
MSFRISAITHRPAAFGAVRVRHRLSPVTESAGWIRLTTIHCCE